jgi:putative membrane protein
VEEAGVLASDGMGGMGSLPAPGAGAAFTDWTFTPVADVLAVAVTLVYLLLVRRLRLSGTKWATGRIVSWCGAMATLVIALDSSIGVYSDSLFWVHMLQHLILIMVVPVLLVCAQPVRLLHLVRVAGGAADEPVRAGVARRVLTSPITAMVLYAAVLVGTHLTGFQEVMTTHAWVHDAETVLYLVSGYLLFGPLLGHERWPWQVPYLLRFGLLAVTMGVDTLVGVVLMLNEHALAPGFALSHPSWGPGALADQKTAGAIMWFGGDGLMMVLMVITAIEWGQIANENKGLGGWLEGIRMRELLGDDAMSIGDNADGEEVDLDQRALDAYNANLAALHRSGGEVTRGRPPA